MSDETKQEFGVHLGGGMTLPVTPSRVTGMRQSLVSYHLRALREAGLVRATAIGRTNVYELADSDLDRVAALLGTLPPE